MTKNLLQDVKIKHQRGRTESASALGSVQTEPKALTGGTKFKHTIWIVVIISVLFFFFSISYLFLRAVITINPKIQNISLNENLVANLNGDTGTLQFNLIVISGEEEKIEPTIEKKDVVEKGRGVVVIYNAFSGGTQRLDTDTRLEGSNGKIYKTEKQVIVPGMKDGVPGSVEVGIYGAEGGEEYNSSPLDFPILGFKGTPKYSKFYARSKGAIVGGLKGTIPFVSDNQKASLENEMKKNLEIKLFKKATDQIPNGFVLFKDATFFNVNENTIDYTSSKENISMKLKGTLYGFLFNEEKLTKKLTEKNIKEDDTSVVYMPNIKDLTFSLSAQTGLSDKENISFANVKNINFNLKGEAKVVWKVDEAKLITDLLGKSKKDFNQVLLQYPNINSANLTISPFWKNSIPNKAKDIKVIVSYPK